MQYTEFDLPEFVLKRLNTFFFFVVNPQGLEPDLTTKYHSLQRNFCRGMIFFGSI